MVGDTSSDCLRVDCPARAARRKRVGNEVLVKTGVLLAADGLHPSSKGVRRLSVAPEAHRQSGRKRPLTRHGHGAGVSSVMTSTAPLDPRHLAD